MSLRRYIWKNNHPVMPVAGLLSVLRHYPKWVIKGQSKRSPLEDARPWINFDAQSYLDSIINDKMQVFEYGMGGSTLYFAKRVKMIGSVEHDPEWFRKVEQKITEQGISAFRGQCKPPKLLDMPIAHPNYANPTKYLSKCGRYKDYSFKDYACSIDAYPNDHFDLVFVDGRARPSCIWHAVPKVRLGGFLVLDNSDRCYYTEQLGDRLQNFEKVFERFGPGPYSSLFTGTTFFKKSINV
jgi:hypothetical protein